MVVRAIPDFDENIDVKTDAGRMYCCGIAELYAVHNNPVEKIKTALYKARHQISAGYVIATTNPNQKVTEENLKTAGFKVLYTGHNPRMGRDFTVWGIVVKDIPKDTKLDNEFLGADYNKGGAKNALGNVFIP